MKNVSKFFLVGVILIIGFSVANSQIITSPTSSGLPDTPGFSTLGNLIFGGDTNLSRVAAGVVGVGTGAQGSMAGTLRVTGIGHASAVATGWQLNQASNAFGLGPSMPIQWGSTSQSATIDTGVSRASAGVVGIGNGTNADVSAKLQALTYLTATNCSSSASPAVCASASAGTAVIAAAATTVIVNTTAVTANSEIIVDEDQSLGAKLSVTCNTQSLLVVGPPRITARTAATSFTVGVDVAPTTNPICFSYHIVN